MSETSDDAAYKIVISDSPSEMVEMVNVLMAEGWIPQGGVAVATDSTSTREYCGESGCYYCFYQAMVRPTPGKPR